MTALETLEKYGLKTDAKSIRERMEKNDYHNISRITLGVSPTQYELMYAKQEARSADLTLLCELAEKGERAIEIVSAKRKDLAKMYSVVCETEPQKAIAKTVDNVLEEIIEELKGEPR